MTTPDPTPSQDDLVEVILNRLALHACTNHRSTARHVTAALRDLLRVVRLRREPDVSLAGLFSWAHDEAERRIAEQRDNCPGGIFQ